MVIVGGAADVFSAGSNASAAPGRPAPGHHHPSRRRAQIHQSAGRIVGRRVPGAAGTGVSTGHARAVGKEIILQIISLDRRTARDVMRPRSQMACIADDLSVEEMIAAAKRYKHRRLPMYDETPDTIVGILNTRALVLDPQMDLADCIELPSFVPESMNLLRLLKSLQRQQRSLAVVLYEFGGTAGIVAM